MVVVGLEPVSWLKSIALLRPLRGLKGTARGLPGFSKGVMFKAGAYQFTALVWDNAEALETFQGSDALAALNAAADKASRFHQTHAFVTETLPTKDEIAQLWRTARHAGVA